MMVDIKVRILMLFGLNLTIMLGSLFLNVCLHEIAHYAVADFFDLDPKINLEGPTKMRFNALETQIYVSYSAQASTIQNLLIAIAGPLANLIFAISMLFARFLVKNKVDDMIFIAVIIPAILSFILNILPFPNSDGLIAYNCFKEILNHLN